MPAPISFAFPEAIASTGPSVAEGGVSGSASAAVFGQLIDAATASQGGLMAQPAAPQPAGWVIPAAAADGTELLMPPPVVTAPADQIAPDVLKPSKEGEQTDELPLIALLEKPKATQVAQPSHAAQAQPVPTKTVPAAETMEAAEPKLADSELADIEDAPAAAPDDLVDVPQEPVIPAIVAAKPEAPQPQAAAHILAALAPAPQPAPDGAARDTEDSAADLLESAPVPTAVRRKADHHASAQAITVMPDAVKEKAQPVRAPSTAQVHAGQIAAPKMEVAEASLPAALLTQTLSPISANVTSNPYPVPAALMQQVPVVAARTGQMGTDIGVEIAKVAKGDGDSLLIRLDPRDMGRVDVRLSFDKDGVLRAVMSVDSLSALEMLRRESGDLNRALADAGVRSDAQSLRFDTRSGEGTGQGSPSWRDSRSAGGGSSSEHDSFGEQNTADYQPLRTSSQIDLIA